MAIIKKLFFSPVKSLSFQNTSECEIIKNVGIKNDRLIAFTRNADLKTAKILEKNSDSRNHKDFLSLKNTVSLNKYSFDLTHSKETHNTISLINLNSIKEFSDKISTEIEFQRFRGNIYIDNIDPWEERKWVGKIISINDIKFKVDMHIPRCSATNLKPQTDINTINLPLEINKIYKHSDMGVYLKPLESGIININDKIII